MNHGADGPRVWTAKVLTLFPEMFPGPLGHSLAGKALENGVWALESVDIRSFARDKHRSVDDTPFGGGAGMVMRPDVLDAALTATAGPVGAPGRGRAIYLSPRGRVLNQELVKELAATPVVTLLCGRYEGVDQRVLDAHGLEEVSLGDFVLSGGELAALSLMDAVVRLLPGVMGNAETAGEESFERGLLEYPHYTRPAVWTDGQGVERAVPEVLLSGHHGKVKAWRLAEAERITEARRPDLWSLYQASRPAETVTNKGRRQARRRDPKPE
ncbi:tRNA (guanosine(37)-N1)-methyltransferase TrmD [Azospirillum oryzae]|uniref:tRNA (guanine-N(1)-)-methyltransferase n=2 Tax=Azospirillum oryzae TaxID=286727 RepID=A0A6N1AUC0_9PROT|nr:tRNA (guanosine(37)-N1)-methyltransferase TrmD [Azospirillum oryzae]KAA0591572.1 tRNA (guanosine(37)-N1)-methyltransferase TrmD [Azospirillum oryzae]QKS52864.1 tRNA (guanosine(37)-N1)-methyltransferase TrmD [Azospirillum oryzae]GLR81590.1 tRNA (guanine-N(1)-)-methyltransferase [Azospirillum oryzae]